MACGLVRLLAPGFLSFPFQFMVVGVFGNNPEPAIAVDAISIAPCGGENRDLGTPGRIRGWRDLGVGVGSWTECLRLSSWNLLESFPQCDFEDRNHPFCDWSQMYGDIGHWSWGSKSVPTPISGSPREFPYGGEETEDLLVVMSHSVCIWSGT